jgi:hypothetical protein
MLGVFPKLGTGQKLREVLINKIHVLLCHGIQQKCEGR